MKYEFNPPAPVECPECHKVAGIVIVRGFPSPEASQAAADGKVILGGCIVSRSDPDRQCTACGHQFRGPSLRADKPMSSYQD